MSRNEKIKEILNLKTNDSIGEELASRQLEVISKAYQYLSNPGKNIVYIADEVGLGKTYIAAGIALLLRHFNPDPKSHREVIIVPKKNLQTKWKKELSNFIKNNYRGQNDLIKQQYVLSDCIKDKIFPIRFEDPFSIFRMTSFSAVSTRRNRGNDLYNNLVVNIFGEDELAVSVLDYAFSLGYFNKSNESLLRKLVAYLFNALSPKIDCLIVDEAHNYKHGLGNETHDEAIRNEVTARFLGAVRDQSILSAFPGLAAKVKFPLAAKIICLSATPKDRNLLEIKNQFNCLSINHCLKDAKTKEDVKALLRTFLIRGNLEYQIEGKSISRNQCRFEHRLGNINKAIDANPLTVQEGFESLFWQLLQYKSLKHLGVKNNASFEIGMLAGFESYQLDIDKANINIESDEEAPFEPNKEYEMTAHRKEKRSQDFNVVTNIISSFQETFKSNLPPHPKLSQLEDEIIDQLGRQEKSLIFVRRVATAYEIEKRILDRYEKDIIVGKYLNFSGKYKKYRSVTVEELIQQHGKKDILIKLDDFFKVLFTKDEVLDALKGLYPDYFSKQDEILYLLRFCYRNEQAFGFLVDNHIAEQRKNISSDLKKAAVNSISIHFDSFQNMLIEEGKHFQADEDEDTSGYFFLNYFKRGQAGYSYRSKMYREPWFEIELKSFADRFGFLEYDKNALEKLLSEKAKGGKERKHQLFQQEQELIQKYFKENSTLVLTKDFNGVMPNPESTFITHILSTHCYEEMTGWLRKKTSSRDIDKVISELTLLNTLIRSIFRNGSGLLPGFVADGQKKDFTKALTEITCEEDAPFKFVIEEIKTVIRDFDFLVSINFPELDNTKIDNTLRDLSPVVGTTGQDKIDRGILATKFRMPGFPYVLVTTDIFREGEDLHSYCQNVYHYGIAWNPSDMEQRTGRIDRINSLSYRKLTSSNRLDFNNKVQVFYPYLSQSIEVNQVAKLLKNINIFIETFNEIEAQNNYESSVSIDEKLQRSDIPKQINTRLKSLYDISEFKPD